MQSKECAGTMVALLGKCLNGGVLRMTPCWCRIYSTSLGWTQAKSAEPRNININEYLDIRLSKCPDIRPENEPYIWPDTKQMQNRIGSIP